MERRENQGEKIVQWMETVLAETGWSAQAWAERANISPTTLTRRMEARVGIPHKATIRKLNKALADKRPDLQLGRSAVGDSDGRSRIITPGESRPPPGSAVVKGWILGDGKVANRPKNLADIDIAIRPIVLPSYFHASGLCCYVVDDPMMWPFQKNWCLFFSESNLEDCIDKYCLATLKDGSQWFRMLRINGNRWDLDHTVPTISMRGVEIQSILRLEHIMTSLPTERQPS